MNPNKQSANERAKLARALKTGEAPKPEKEPEIEDQQTKDWTKGFELIKSGDKLPEDANESMLEGGRAAQQQAAIIQQAQERLAAPPKNPYGAGMQVEFDVGEETHGKDWDSSVPELRPQQVRSRNSLIPVVVDIPQPPPRRQPVQQAELPADYEHQIRRAQDVIRAAQERAAKETAAATAFLQFSSSSVKKKAFLDYCDSLTEVPGPPPLTAYGSGADDQLCYLADWKPEEFLAKYARSAAPLVVDLRREINSR